MVYSSTSFVINGKREQAIRIIFQSKYFWVLSLDCYCTPIQNENRCIEKSAIDHGGYRCVDDFIIDRFIFFGKERNGAKGWLEIAGFSIQPAEYLKIIAIWYFSFTLSQRQMSVQKNFIGNGQTTSIASIGIDGYRCNLARFWERNGHLLITMVLLLASGINYVYTLIVGFGGVWFKCVYNLASQCHSTEISSQVDYNISIIVLLFFKILFSDELNSGHQMVNGYYAMFNGGLFGRGLGNSIQKKGFLTRSTNRFHLRDRSRRTRCYHGDLDPCSYYSL